MKKKKIIVPIVIMAFIIAVTVDILILSRGTEAKDVEMAKILLEECEESIVIDSYTITMTGTYIQENTGFFLVSFAVIKEGGIPEVTFKDGGDGELKENSFGENNRFCFKFDVTGGRYMKGELSGNTLYLYFRAHLHPDDDDIGELSECFRLIDSKNENEKTLSGFDEYHFCKFRSICAPIPVHLRRCSNLNCAEFCAAP